MEPKGTWSVQTIPARTGESGARPSQRRPYRVVFTPHPTQPERSDSTQPVGSGPISRRGVIVARDEEAAHREARRIADAGGHAAVEHIDDSGQRHTLATYPVEGQAPPSRRR